MAFFTKSAFLIAVEHAQREQAEATKYVRLHTQRDHKSQYKFASLTPEFFRKQRRQQNVLRRKQLREEYHAYQREIAVIEEERIKERIEAERLANAVVPMVLPVVRHHGGHAANNAGFAFEERVRESILKQNGIRHRHFKVHDDSTGRDLTDIDAYVPFCQTEQGLCPVIVEMKVTVGHDACKKIPEQIETQFTLFPNACVVLYTEDTLNLDKLKKNLHARLDSRFRGRWTVATEPMQLLGLLRQDVRQFQYEALALIPMMPSHISLL